MADPKMPDPEPRRVSQPGKTRPDETPTPVEAPKQPSEWEKEVPHTGSQPVALTGRYGEGNYEATREYAEGYEEFASQTTPDESVRKGKKIDPDDPALKEAEQRGKRAEARPSAPSIH